MIFHETPLPGAFVIEQEPRGDERGFFARAFCKQEYEAHGLNHEVVQMNNSVSRDKGTLRGMHYQLAPKAEDKIIRCIQGRLYDVILDLRSGAPTFGQWYAEELTPENRKMLYVPKGFAHGFMTLEDHTEVLYMVTEYYAPEQERGVRWNDPKFNIDWPMPPVVISEKDQKHPDFDPAHHLA